MVRLRNRTRASSRPKSICQWQDQQRDLQLARHRAAGKLPDFHAAQVERSQAIVNETFAVSGVAPAHGARPGASEAPCQMLSATSPAILLNLEVNTIFATAQPRAAAAQALADIAQRHHCFCATDDELRQAPASISSPRCPTWRNERGSNSRAGRCTHAISRPLRRCAAPRNAALPRCTIRRCISTKIILLDSRERRAVKGMIVTVPTSHPMRPASTSEARSIGRFPPRRRCCSAKARLYARLVRGLFATRM